MPCLCGTMKKVKYVYFIFYDKKFGYLPRMSRSLDNACKALCKSLFKGFKEEVNKHTG